MWLKLWNLYKAVVIVWMNTHHHQLLVAVRMPWVGSQITECITGLSTMLVQVLVVDLPTQLVPLVALQHAGLDEKSHLSVYLFGVLFLPTPYWDDNIGFVCIFVFHVHLILVIPSLCWLFFFGLVLINFLSYLLTKRKLPCEKLFYHVNISCRIARWMPKSLSHTHYHYYHECCYYYIVRSILVWAQAHLLTRFEWAYPDNLVE